MDREDWIKVGKGFLIALTGAVLTFVTTQLIPALEQSNEAWLLVLAAFLSTASNMIRKFLFPSNKPPITERV